MVCVPEEYGTADALRAVAPRVSAPTCIVLSGDLVTGKPCPEKMCGGALHAYSMLRPLHATS